MKAADRLLLKNGFDLKGNYTGVRKVILKKRQVVKKNSKEYLKKRKRAKQSQAEVKIAKFLSSNGIRYKTEYWFRGCYNKRNQLLYFDFYLPDYHAVIEFDGIHHFKPVYGEAVYRSTQMNDWFKNKYCKRCNIPLLRIHCYDSQNIEKIICEWFDKNFR